MLRGPGLLATRLAARGPELKLALHFAEHQRIASM